MAYCAQSNIENLYGQDNVVKWSNLAGTTDAVDATRVAAAIAWADEQIDNRLRKTQYAIPFTTVPLMVLTWSATLAGWWLYKARGQRDTNEWNKMEGERKDVYEELGQVAAGAINLDAAKVASDDPESIAVIT